MIGHQNVGFRTHLATRKFLGSEEMTPTNWVRSKGDNKLIVEIKCPIFTREYLNFQECRQNFPP